MSNTAVSKNKKPIYKKWWGIILLILIWPITLGWLIWKKTDWPQGGKIGATIILAIVVITINQSDSSPEKKKEPLVAKEEQVAVQAEKNELNESKEENPTLEKKLNISYGDMMNYLSNVFVMQPADKVNGKDRWMGQTSNQLALLELIGDKANLSSTSLMIGVPSDNPQVLVENSGILLRFVKNSFPDWTEGTDWATNALKEAAQKPNQPVERVYGNKSISLTAIKELGMVSVTVKPL